MSIRGVSRDRLLRVLTDAEWFLPMLNDEPRCPVCEERKPSSYTIGKPPEVVTEGGHAPGCRLARLIADVERNTDDESFVGADRVTVDSLADALDKIGTCWTHEGSGSVAREMAQALYDNIVAQPEPPRQLSYKGILTLPGSTTIEASEEILDKLREYGSADYRNRREIGYHIEAPDQWDLREILDSIAADMAANYDLDLAIDKAKVE